MFFKKCLAIFVRVEGPQIDIQDKNQLSLLRQQLEEQKRQKETGGTTITEEKTSITDGKHFLSLPTYVHFQLVSKAKPCFIEKIINI